VKTIYPGLSFGKATRDAYGEALRDLGKEHKEIVVLDADLAKSTKSAVFGEAFPDRFWNVGIQEANMVGMAGGFASSGKVPFISSFAAFVILKGFDQLRMAVAYPHLNVKVAGSHGGISIGETVRASSRSRTLRSPAVFRDLSFAYHPTSTKCARPSGRHISTRGRFTFARDVQRHPSSIVRSPILFLGKPTAFVKDRMSPSSRTVSWSRPALWRMKN